jgi:hypothetical protein
VLPELYNQPLLRHKNQSRLLSPRSINEEAGSLQGFRPLIALYRCKAMTGSRA